MLRPSSTGDRGTVLLLFPAAFLIMSLVAPLGAHGSASDACEIEGPDGIFGALVFPIRVVGHVICLGAMACIPESTES